MVNMPLWTARPDKMKAVSWNEDNVILEPDEVAQAMLNWVESDDYPGGTVLEVLKETTRVVEVDSPIAQGKGVTMSRMELVTRDTLVILKREQMMDSGGG
jgi:hypothetical protein